MKKAQSFSLKEIKSTEIGKDLDLCTLPTFCNSCKKLDTLIGKKIFCDNFDASWSFLLKFKMKARIAAHLKGAMME